MFNVSSCLFFYLVFRVFPSIASFGEQLGGVCTCVVIYDPCLQYGVRVFPSVRRVTVIYVVTLVDGVIPPPFLSFLLSPSDSFSEQQVGDVWVCTDLRSTFTMRGALWISFE